MAIVDLNIEDNTRSMEIDQADYGGDILRINIDTFGSLGSIADNIPHRDLTVSPGHHLFFDGNLVPAMALVNNISIVQLVDMVSFEYFHIELEQFDILLAEGVPAESYVDTGNRKMFQNAHEVEMNPDFGPAKGRPDIPGMTVVRKGPVLEAIRARLLERANWMQMPETVKRVG
ncbi:Hint domain-containing protein [Advenella mimigardefordensis]|uniref:Hedgehog/Intein (Hint) domain-containing protein n=1 Tax=Advenella mimigardefordensis (strain DSM 17166 / LMG 22922 / DPN7) TaxID=1247726 RepID=W0P9G1_ADVMD|nr:Hint domain-containing protein [Advenella mimigardefordensis]AHG63494.1 hypothetical protein MIM_c14020 [Advenella mimigardefordensis DPN7]